MLYNTTNMGDTTHNTKTFLAECFRNEDGTYLTLAQYEASRRTIEARDKAEAFTILEEQLNRDSTLPLNERWSIHELNNPAITNMLTAQDYVVHVTNRHFGMERLGAVPRLQARKNGFEAEFVAARAILLGRFEKHAGAFMHSLCEVLFASRFGSCRLYQVLMGTAEPKPWEPRPFRAQAWNITRNKSFQKNKKLTI